MIAFETETSFRARTVELMTPPRTRSKPASLLQAVQAAAQKVEHRLLRPVVENEGSLAFQPRVLLALITFCYARQIYASTDIEAVLARDPAFCQACQNRFPPARVIRQFRRENREALQICLLEVLSFLACQKLENGLVTRVSKTFLAAEASRRLVMAGCLDNMAEGASGPAF